MSDTSSPTSTPRPLSSAQPALCGVEIAHASGSTVTDESGDRLVDLTAGVGTLALGHAHPEVVEAATGQMTRLGCTGGAASHPPARELAGRLAEIAPDGIDVFALATTGAEANELALRLARRATGRAGVVAFSGGFHGRTAGAQAVSSAVPGQQADCGRRAEVEIAPFPADDGEDAVERAVAALDELHRRRLPAAETACYIIEPVQGVGGCRPTPRRFLEALRERADREGILLVVDEVQTGLCRTGAWFATGRLRVRPDVLVLGKAIGGGLPLSAVGASAEVMSAIGPGDHGSTFGGHPVACAAALAVLGVMERDGLAARSARLGSEVLARLSAELGEVSSVRQVRGLGLMIGIEMATPDLAEHVQAAARRAGVLVLRSGPRGEVVRILPPLSIARAELMGAIRAVADIVRASTGGASARPPTPDRSATLEDDSVSPVLASGRGPRGRWVRESLGRRRRSLGPGRQVGVGCRGPA